MRALLAALVLGGASGALRLAPPSSRLLPAVALRPSRVLARARLVRASSTGGDEEFDAEADAALVNRLEAEVVALTGTGLDGLLNPMKLVNLERDLIKLRSELEQLPEGSPEAAAIRETIEQKEETAYYEKRTVMKGWLRSVFRVQSYLAILVSALVSFDALPLAGHLDVSVRVVGFWSWWLFTIPSLRSIKPLVPQEKSALNWAFLAVLFVSLLAPVATKNTGAIWTLDAAAVGLCYAYFYTIGADGAEQARAGGADDGAEKSGVEKALRFALRAIDFGSGVERGVRSSEKTALERTFEESIESRARRGVEERPASGSTSATRPPEASGSPEEADAEKADSK